MRLDETLESLAKSVASATHQARVEAVAVAMRAMTDAELFSIAVAAGIAAPEPVPVRAEAGACAERPTQGGQGRRWGTVGERIVALLAENPAREWSTSEIIAALGENSATVKSALARIRVLHLAQCIHTSLRGGKNPGSRWRAYPPGELPGSTSSPGQHSIDSPIDSGSTSRVTPEPPNMRAPEDTPTATASDTETRSSKANAKRGGAR